MQPLPHRYEVALICDGPHARVESEGRTPFVGGAPPEFDGDQSVWSPEQLLLAAVGLCLFTTFRAVAKGTPLAGYRYHDRVDGVLDQTPQGPRFSSVTHHVELAVFEPDRERVAQLLQKAKQHCIIAATLNVPVHLEYRINVSL